LPPDGILEVALGVVVPGDWPKERPEPGDRVLPHPVEDLVARHARSYRKEADPLVVVVEEEAGEDEQEEDGEAVEVYPAVVDRPGEDDVPKRLVDQVGEHGAQCGERDNPPVTDKTCQHKADEDAGHDVGEEIHRHPVAGQPYTLFPGAGGAGVQAVRYRRILHCALLIRNVYISTEYTMKT